MNQILLITLVTIFSMSSYGAKLKGTVRVDGSSTVFPITEAVAEEFGKVQPRVRAAIGVAGTGGGFKKFCNGEIDVNDASRSIKPKEATKCKAKNIEFIELSVAFDGITVVVNPKNDWAKSITKAELNKIWKPGSTVKTWKDVRASWPDKPIKLYGPGTDSGTFDYFTKAINGKSHVSRSNYTKSEDDNMLVKGVSGDKYALGYFGFAYYKENKSRLRSLPVDDGKGPVAATEKTINNGTYTPLSRPIFIYVSKGALKKPQVYEFVKFYMQNAKDLVSETGYIPLPNKQYAQETAKVEKARL